MSEVFVDEYGTKEWFLNGKLHRIDGPAVELISGTKEWWVDGKPHREDGPAIERKNGDREWYLNGKLHRIDGPAVEWVDGNEQWWVDGTQLDQHPLSAWLIERRLYSNLKRGELNQEQLMEIKVVFGL